MTWTHYLFKSLIEHYCKFGLDPDEIACDLDPEMYSTRVID